MIGNPMATFHLSIVSPEALMFSGDADQVDLPGVEGNFGVLPGHAPLVAMLRPGIATVRADETSERFVLFGGLAEISQTQVTVLADSAKSVDDFDLTEFKALIDDMEESLAESAPGDELDRAIARLDHYRSIHVYLNSYESTAF